MKSKGIAAVLALLFGPIGLFYATVSGGLMMLFVIPLLTVFLAIAFWSNTFGVLIISSIIFLCVFYNLICMIWAIIAVDKYNNKILAEANYYDSNTDESIISDDIANKKSQLLQDLGTIKKLLDTGAINQSEYEKRKDVILNKIEILEHNDTIEHSSNAENYEEIPNTSNSIFNGKVIILASIIIALLAFVLYDTETKSLNFDRITNLFSANSKEKKEVATQLEKAYFDVTNGTIRDEMPFYNANTGSLFLTSFLTMLKYESNTRIEPVNIDVYELSDDKRSGKVRYNLMILKGADSIKVSIDMNIKKVGTFWKFDSEKFFQFDFNEKVSKKKTTTINESKNLNNYSTNLSQDNEVSSAKDVNKIEELYEVTGVNQKNGNGEYEIIPFKGDKQFLFTNKKILEVTDGRITNTWHIKKIVDDGVDLFVYKTEEGLDISFEGFLVVAYPDGTSKSYQVNEINKKQLKLK